MISPKRRLLGLGLGCSLFGCCFGYSFNCCFGCGLLERSLHSCDNLGYGGLLGIDGRLHGLLDAGLALLLNGCTLGVSLDRKSVV